MAAAPASPPLQPPAFHAGQVRMQELCGTRKVAAGIEPHLAASIDGSLVDALQDASLAYVAYQTVDGLTWVSAISLPSSSSVPLVQVVSSTRVRVRGDVDSSDPLHEALDATHAMIGITVMQEWTRDRFRVMGRLVPPTSSLPAAGPAADATVGVRTACFELETALVMSLCPKYIVDRRITHRRAAGSSAITVHESCSTGAPQQLPQAAVELITHADTFWLGTTVPTWGSQSSHRGGLPGLLRVTVAPSSTLPRLQWGDYKGNSMFHSLGAALDNPLAGLLLLDYEAGHCLQLAGKLETVFAQQPGTDLDGASRHVQFDVMQWRWTTAIVPFVFRTVSHSYHSPRLHEPLTSQQAVRAALAGAQLTELELASVVRESRDIATFRLRAVQASDRLPQWLPSQYATLRLMIDEVQHERSWTITSLSSATRDYTLDLTIKRAEGGVVSTFLHQRAAPGLRFGLLGIEGGFTTPSMYWTESTEGVSAVHGRPARKLWLSAGIGITPFLAHMRTYLRFHSMHEQAHVPVPPSDILWLHMDQTLEHVPRLDEIAAFIHSSSALHFTAHFVLCLTRRTEQDSAGWEGDKARFAAQFRGLDMEDEFGHMPLAQVVAGRGTAMTLVHVCRCPPRAPHVPVRCDDTLDCRNAVLLEDRGVDACGSAPVMALFRSWTDEWKAMGISIRNFRTESFAY